MQRNMRSKTDLTKRLLNHLQSTARNFPPSHGRLIIILIIINGVKEIFLQNTNVVIMTNKISNENDSAGPQKEEIESDQMNGATLYLKGKREKAAQREPNWSRFLNTRKPPKKDWTFQYIPEKNKSRSNRLKDQVISFNGAEKKQHKSNANQSRRPS